MKPNILSSIGELFPTKTSAIIFIAYIILFINQGIFVTASQDKNSYNYNTITVVLLSEFVKLCISLGLYLKNDTFSQMIQDIKLYSNVFFLYFIPAFLYCIYNNLAFISLSSFDPTTYYLLLQFRVVVTGIIYQLIFKKKLSKIQWFSLILLTIGCMIKQIDFSVLFDSSGKKTLIIYNYWGFTMIFIQTLCSCFAGVYNEYLLKDKGADVNIFIQNIFMYVDSIICSVSLLYFKGELISSFSKQSLSHVFVIPVLLIIFNNALAGITTSLFLKNLNSILKIFASAIEFIFTAVLCWIIFSIPIHINTIISIFIVSLSIYFYSKNPISPKVPEKSYDKIPLYEQK